MIDIKQDEYLSKLNHSCAHMMAQAVKRLYPQAQFWVGPVISDGFYYDIDLGDEVIRDEDLAKIEKEMKKIAKDGKRIIREEISKADAMEMFKDDKYKIELINDLEDGSITSSYHICSSKLRMIMPLGSINGIPGAYSLIIKIPSSRPSFL